jgi:hypothetical protein
MGGLNYELRMQNAEFEKRKKSSRAKDAKARREIQREVLDRTNRTYRMKPDEEW